LLVSVVPSIGSTAMLTGGEPGPPRAELLAHEDAGRLVLDPLADRARAAHVHQVEHAAEGVRRRLVGRDLVPLADPLKDVQRGRLAARNRSMPISFSASTSGCSIEC
jgi:hypothetical protein